MPKELSPLTKLIPPPSADLAGRAAHIGWRFLSDRQSRVVRAERMSVFELFVFVLAHPCENRVTTP